MALGANQYTTITETMAIGATSATLTSAAFDNGVQVPLVVDYDVPDKLEVIWADITGTALSNISRAKDDTSAVEHTGTPKIAIASVPSIFDRRHSDNGGWIPAFETWAYASASTITVPSDARLKYSVGDKIKLTQAVDGVKYFYIIAVAETVLTITGGTDYDLDNATITSPYYSKSTSPVGFPQWFSWTPSYSANGSMTYTSVTTLKSRFSISGRTLNYYLSANGTIGGTPSTLLQFTTPVNRAGNNAYDATGYGEVNNAVGEAAKVLWASTSQSTIGVLRTETQDYITGGGNIRIAGSYEI